MENLVNKLSYCIDETVIDLINLIKYLEDVDLEKEELDKTFLINSLVDIKLSLIHI